MQGFPVNPCFSGGSVFDEDMRFCYFHSLIGCFQAEVLFNGIITGALIKGICFPVFCQFLLSEFLINNQAHSGLSGLKSC